MARLVRKRDGAGDSGGMSMLIKCKKDGDWYVVEKDPDGQPIIEYGKPKIGYMVRVGSVTARSYSSQDYWQTTPVIEIIEEKEDYVKFKTASPNESIYEWFA